MGQESMENKEIYFQSGKNKLFGRLYVSGTYDRGVVFLHGGGASTSIRYAYLQNECYKNNIASFAFDFRGCGKSEGVFADGSLMNREIDTTNAINCFLSETKLDSSRFYLWGASMGAHVVCKLLDTIVRMVLFSNVLLRMEKKLKVFHLVKNLRGLFVFLEVGKTLLLLMSLRNIKGKYWSCTGIMMMLFQQRLKKGIEIAAYYQNMWN